MILIDSLDRSLMDPPLQNSSDSIWNVSTLCNWPTLSPHPSVVLRESNNAKPVWGNYRSISFYDSDSSIHPHCIQLIWRTLLRIFPIVPRTPLTIQTTILLYSIWVCTTESNRRRLIGNVNIWGQLPRYRRDQLWATLCPTPSNGAYESCYGQQIIASQLWLASIGLSLTRSCTMVSIITISVLFGLKTCPTLDSH